MSKKKKAPKAPYKRVIITNEKYGLPYSKGLMASAIMATGLAPGRSYQVAKLVEDYLYQNGISSLNIDELRLVAHKVLEINAGVEYAEKYLKWQALGKLDKPLIVMIGGTTGVGKSTIATELAHRLAITRIVSTDSIREVMRALFSEQMMPTLHRSSYDAWKALRTPLPQSADPVTVALGEQTSAVLVGIKAIIDRAIKEGVHLILEGVHIMPGMIETFHDKAFMVPVIISVEEEDLHRSHFYVREIETDGMRSYKRYRQNFENIRKIGLFIEGLALKHNIPIIRSQQLDTTISLVLSEVINQAINPQLIPMNEVIIKEKD